MSEVDKVPPASLSGMLSTLAPVAVMSGAYLAIFLVLRRTQRRYYAPRTYLGSLRESERSPPLPNGFIDWFFSFWKIPDIYALQHQSLDAYLYIRFLRQAFIMMLVGCLVTWPILFPVNATGSGRQRQLDILSYANIDNKTESDRYYAIVFVSWAYFGFIMYMIMRECIFYINLRQAFLLSPFYSERISSRTVLFTDVPEPYLTEAKLRRVFGSAVNRVWITSDTSEVDDLVTERDKVAMRLENAEVNLIKLANKLRQRAIKNGTDTEKAPIVGDHANEESGSVAARWVPAEKRPTHRLGPLGLWGEKVDSINWCREQLARLVPEADAAQAKYRTGGYKRINAVFIEFKTQIDAEVASQTLAHHLGYHMQSYVGIRPDEVVWDSLAIPWWQKVIRRYIVFGFIFAMILFWAIPVAFVGLVSNVNYLATISWLEWIKDIPAVILGVITGLLPSVMLSILMSLVPIIIRLCGRIAGEPSQSRIELFTQNAYFAFQVIQVFLVTTLSSSATAVAKQIVDNPTSATSILANNLPKASNLYISYFIVQGLSIATSELTQITGFVIFYLMYKLLANTPRALYQKWTTLSAISWGSTLPIYTNIAVIAITYSCIAPLMLGWATIAMFLFYIAWRYNVFFVTDTQVDTRGLIYPYAIKQLFTGLYLAELCMIGLFGASASPGPLILMVIYLVFTALFHISLNSSLNPLLYNLPRTLLSEEEEIRLMDPEAGVGPSRSADETAEKTEVKDLNDDGVVDDTEAHVAAARQAAKVTDRSGNFLTRFFQPWIYANYYVLRKLVPRHIQLEQYSEEVASNAYHPPNTKSPAPLLWIPEDPAGVSKQEVAHTSRVIPITDEGCTLSEDGKLIWDKERTRPPVWEEKIYY
ncbi:putative phosphate metabolism protein [Thermochaetoides thermophila DSM 1495]|uniref:Putative phosphate metabolism protein n=1 Tax=Chaetomium thermophilum (strain DSM 1495 / CBS 144.50 / IMI 039719) TaxID=759272 RepID=G0S887_CHATD|nr:putative phosphate metabolism protein [Thermochaetoides thermophila DSM 1495]EGS21921.1 putative phosphate metabolism protein [Thermochaetoides thermophila DSM 1495]